MNTELDTRDIELIGQRQEARKALIGPLVGDFVHMLDGSLRRFTHDWGDGLQTTCGPSSACYGDVSFYLNSNGNAGFSGSLDPSIPNARLEIVPHEYNDGGFWIFHHDFAAAYAGVSFSIPCKVYREIAP